MLYAALIGISMSLFFGVAPGIFANPIFLTFTCGVVGFLGGVAVAAVSQHLAMKEMLAEEKNAGKVLKFKG